MADHRGLRVLGIDPGLTRMGYGAILDVSGTLSALECGTLRTDPSGSIESRLGDLFDQLSDVFSRVSPDFVGIEKVFLKLNALSAIPAIQAAGVALLVAGRLGIPVHEYSPAQVKKAVVGTGTASKEQVRYMVDRLLGKVVDVPTADASDALGIAITHLNSHRMERMIGAAG